LVQLWLSYVPSVTRKSKKGVKLFQKIRGNTDTLATSLTLTLWIFAIELQRFFKFTIYIKMVVRLNVIELCSDFLWTIMLCLPFQHKTVQLAVFCQAGPSQRVDSRASAAGDRPPSEFSNMIQI